MSAENVLAIARSLALALKAWPPHLLLLDLQDEEERDGVLDEEEEEDEEERKKKETEMSVPSMSAFGCELGLPEEAATWTNTEILDFFRVQKVGAGGRVRGTVFAVFCPLCRAIP